MGKHDFISKKTLEHLTGRTAYTAAANHDWALYTTTPTHTTAGTEVTTSGTAYVRQTTAGSSTTWAAAVTATPSTITTLVQIVWATATANYGTVVGAAMFEAGTSNMMYFGTLTNSRIVNTGDSVRFAIGGVVLTEA